MLKRVFFFAVGGLLFAASAHAQLVHRYDFNSVNDSVGTSNGILTGTASSISGGQLNLPSGAAGNSLALPASVTAGLTGSFSIELYATRTTSGGNFSNFFSFANDGNNFLLFNPDRSGFGSRANFKQSNLNGGNEFGVSAVNPVPFPQNAQQQVVLTYNGGTGAINLYDNGVQFANGSLPGFNLALNSNTGAFNGIGGNTPFTGDETFQGSFADFRIYSSELTATQVTALNAAGPDASTLAIAAIVPEPSTWLAMVVGLGSLLGLQRFRRTLA